MSSLADELPVYASSSALVHLPRSLQKPQYKEINRDALASVEPGLRDVPVEYVLRGIAKQASEMLAAISAVSQSVPKALPRTGLPSGFSASVPPQVAHSAPTHVLAVASAGNAAPNVTLIPTHHLVLAAHCANVPGLPRSAPSNGGRVMLPVVPFTVPSASTFAILHSYLYTKRLDSLLNALLPLPAHFVPSTLQSAAQIHGDARKRAAQHVAATLGYSADHLARYVGLVHSLWKNIVSLGVYDKELWQALDLAWDVVVNAVYMANGRQ
ncbi:hypothetical protein GLOTRDRAFT_50449 [Gloeophyllum trabeum ATCC 11539]|uniref:Clp1-like protein n=1 Tax=Gloeophyllum trabeum (strain ATCC 11539 / FP-39264 / Madison 617) TaxID=670483 RepID=S7PT90_GLOTA|nr:uncharacterized protein GLOTRDRAFT_50449 [Gloeophyllum trabeum ATCC 11539]EPQ50522.1 hypothetical protein GLOTRDRAFT_50449 [Gloeophyllum trabeum ATCC 11539]